MSGQFIPTMHRVARWCRRNAILKGHLAVLLPRRQDRRARRERRRQEHAAAHHGRRGQVRRRGVPQPASRSASCPRSRSSTPGKTCAATSRRRWPRPRRCSMRQRDLRKVGRADVRRRDEQAPAEQAKVQEQIDATNAWDLDASSRSPWTPCACRRGTRT